MGFLNKIFDILGLTPKQDASALEPHKMESKKMSSNDESYQARIDELDKTINDLKNRERLTRIDNINWDAIKSVESEEKQISIFQRYSFGNILTLSFLKKERIRKEKERISKLTLETLEAISKAHLYVKQENLNKASELLIHIRKAMEEVQDESVKQKHDAVQEDLRLLKEKIRKEEVERRIAELKRKEEERKQKEEEERKRRREEERRTAIQHAQQEQERLERERLEAERLAVARKKELAEVAEKRILKEINETKKDTSTEILAYLRSHGVRYFYHFTDCKNLPSIKRHGGLFSWYYCNSHDIKIPYPGGNSDSRGLDTRHGLQDFVRLSFCDDHPMAYRLHCDGADLVPLRISIEVATFEHTRFSDMNAAANAHSNGASFDDLKKVDIAATKQHFVRRNDGAIFHLHQAEVMVKTFIPIEYIENIDNPIKMQFGS